MFEEQEIDEELINKFWSDENDRKQVNDFLGKMIEFTKIPCYTYFAGHSPYCFKGYGFLADGRRLNPIDYGYGLTVESLEKYLIKKYGKNNPKKYLLYSSGLMPMDYEKYYRNGTFVDLNGVKTHKDFYQMPNWEELEGKAQFKDNWIKYEVIELPEK